MLNTIIIKPITKENEEQFKEAMKYVCEHNDLTMMEYSDKYVVAEAPEPVEIISENTISTEERLDDIENALIELAGIVAGE